MFFVTFNFHVNMWYAEYTDEQVLRWFPNLYRRLLEFMWENPDVKVGWDIEVSRTIPFLEMVAPDVLDGLREGVKKGRFEVILDTWSFSLASMHTWEEFEYQHELAVKKLKDVFGRVSSGYFAQEGAYHPVLPLMLEKLGVEFLLFSYFQIREFDRRVSRDLRVHLIEGEEGVKMPIVMHASSILADPVDLVKSAMEFGGGFSVLDDAEIANPRRLEGFVKAFREMDGVEFALASEIVEKAPKGIQVKPLDSTWAFGMHDHGMWVRDPWDQYLWTLNEAARIDIAKAEWWLKQAKKAGLNVELEERNLAESKKWLLLGQNSDKFGWNPRAEKRIQGEYELRLASEFAQIVYTVLSEKASKFNPPPEGSKELVLYNFQGFPLPPSPLRIKVEFDRGVFKPDEVSATLDGEEVRCDLLDALLFPDGTLRSGTLVMVRGMDAESLATLTLKGDGSTGGGDLHASRNELSNGLVKVKLEEGKPVSITDLETGTTYGSEEALIAQRFRLEGDEPIGGEAAVEVTNRGERGVCAEVTSTVKPSEHSLVVNKYRVYSGLSLLEVETKISILGKYAGSAEPLILRIPRPKFIWRELGSRLSKVEVEKGKQRFLLVNDWAAVYSGEMGLLVVADCLTRSMKEVRDAKNEVSFFMTETMFKENLYEHLSGEWTIRAAIIPLNGNLSDGDVAKAKAYSRGVGVIPIIHFEPPRLS